MKTYLKLPLFIAMLFSLTVQANYRQHHAHVHGEAEMNLAITDNEILIEIISPGSDVVGFENQPKNDKQIAELAAAVNLLGTETSIITLEERGECHLSAKSVENTLEDNVEEPDLELEEDKKHGEFRVKYHFGCKDITEVTAIKTHWFTLFPDTETMKVNIVTDLIQKSDVLTLENSIILL